MKTLELSEEIDNLKAKLKKTEKANRRLKRLLSKALKAICLTRDYVGEENLPAIKGWTWYDVGRKIIKEIYHDE